MSLHMVVSLHIWDQNNQTKEKKKYLLFINYEFWYDKQIQVVLENPYSIDSSCWEAEFRHI